MEVYKLGRVVSIGKTYIIFESNNAGSIVYVSNTDSFDLGEQMKLFVYTYKTDFTHALYGFRSFTHRKMFEDLLSINGIGPRTAISMMEEPDVLIDDVASARIKEIAKHPYISNNTASQIVYELFEDWGKIWKEDLLQPEAARPSLETLGFNDKQIEYGISKIKAKSKIELLVEDAIKAISSVGNT